jgi:N-acetylglucosamine malate deacetylase 1
MQSKRTLVLAPHTDDAELGCGGTIARLCEQGAEVFAISFSAAEESLPEHMPADTLRKECKKALADLGLAQDRIFIEDYRVRRLSERRQELLDRLIVARREIEPDLVLVPSVHDIHQDHQVVHAEGVRAFKNVTVLGYELPWNTLTFAAQAFVTLEERHLEKKFAAMRRYESQRSLGRPYFDEEFVRGWARLRGLQAKAPYAEVYEVMRIRW